MPHPGATLTESAVLARPVDELPATCIQSLLADAQPSDDMVKLLTSKHWRLVEMDTAHWPMLSQPLEPAQIFLEATHEGTAGHCLIA